jgi:RNA polymerase sigma factor (sigma-70 family)
MDKNIRRTSNTMVAAMLVGAALATMGPRSPKLSTPVKQERLTDISKYCTACWRNARLSADRWDDATQEVLTRLLERVPLESWDSLLAQEGSERDEFMRAIDTVKKRHQRAKRAVELVDLHGDQREIIDRQRHEIRESINLASTSVLSNRQQRIVSLTCDGYSIPEIAADLGTSEARVSDEKYKAIQKLRKFFGGDSPIA